jgi:hypothetical protein
MECYRGATFVVKRDVCAAHRMTALQQIVPNSSGTLLARHVRAIPASDI